MSSGAILCPLPDKARLQVRYEFLGEWFARIRAIGSPVHEAVLRYNEPTARAPGILGGSEWR
jgi:hypothetical protein